MQMPLAGHDHVRFFLTALFKQLGQLRELRVQLLLKLGRQVVMDAFVADFHEMDPLTD
ncbi:hypothetical protein D3C83_318860 [compost metagenome]